VELWDLKTYLPRFMQRLSLQREGRLNNLSKTKKKRSNHDGYGERTIGAERLAFLLVYACRGSRLTFPPGN
jgi:hypothetical protein